MSEFGRRAEGGVDGAERAKGLMGQVTERGGQPPHTKKSDKNQQLNPANEISVYQGLCTGQVCSISSQQFRRHLAACHLTPAII